MASKTDTDLAYEAGRNAMSEPADRRSVDACPFSPLDHSEEREAWLDGFSDALEEQADLTETRKALQAARAND
jgi:ribosome modulation factor